MTFSWAVPLDNPTDQDIIFGIGLTDINAGKHERRYDDEQADRNADGRHARSDRGAEEFGRKGNQQNEAEIDDQHDQRQRPTEGRTFAHKLPVVWVLLDPLVT